MFNEPRRVGQEFHSLKKTEIVLKVAREMPIRVLYEYGKTKRPDLFVTLKA